MILRESAFNLRCSDCKQQLVVIERPIERSGDWEHVIGRNRRLISDVFMTQEGLQHVREEEGILVCPGAVSVDSAQPPRCLGLIKAVISTNAVVLKDIDQRRACALWPWCINLFEPESMNE